MYITHDLSDIEPSKYPRTVFQIARENIASKNIGHLFGALIINDKSIIIEPTVSETVRVCNLYKRSFLCVNSGVVPQSQRKRPKNDNK